MLLVGLTGGLASGKSHVGHHLERLGCLLVQADVLGHEALMPGGDAFDPVVREFGGSILGEDGRINRRRLAAMVFEQPDRLAILNQIVHPAVRQRTRAILDDFAAQHPDGIAVVEAAILIETGTYKNYDRLIVVTCSEEQQIVRAMNRDGITRDEALARLRMQLPLQEKLKFANYVIDTSGPAANTEAQTRTVFEALRSIHQ